MPSTPRGIGWRTVVGAVVGLAWIGFLLIVYFASAPDPPVATPPPTVAVQPVESYDSEDIRRLLDALDALRDSRLTPEERQVVEDASEVVADIASGGAVVAPATTTTTTTSTTTTTTTTTAPPPTTAPRVVPSVDDFAGHVLDQLSDALP